MHPRRTRGSQSGQEKSRRDKSLQAQVEEPLGTNSHQTISNSLANASIWLGTKNSLYYLAQSANSISWVLFVCSYTTAIFSPYLSGLFIKIVCARETFYSPNQKRRNYQWVRKTFRMLSAGAFLKNLHQENYVSYRSQGIKKAIKLDKVNQQLGMSIMLFLHIFFAVTACYQVKKSNFTFCGVSKQAMTKFSFSF